MLYNIKNKSPLASNSKASSASLFHTSTIFLAQISARNLSCLFFFCGTRVCEFIHCVHLVVVNLISNDPKVRNVAEACGKAVPEEEECRGIQFLAWFWSFGPSWQTIDLNFALLNINDAIQIEAKDVNWQQKLNFAQICSADHKSIHSL